MSYMGYGISFRQRMEISKQCKSSE